MELTINVQASGNYTQDELKDYLLFCLGFGSCQHNNPFVSEDSDAQITDVEIH